MNSFAKIVDEIKNIVSLDFKSKKVFDKDIANILGITQMNFATMKKRNKIPFTELLDFCAVKSISINWILYGQSPESLIEPTHKLYVIKYFNNISASAGGGSEIDSEQIENVEIPEQFVLSLGGEKELKNIEAINVSGDSMEPTLNYNDIVFINRKKTDLSRGGIFVIRTESGLFIKRVIKEENDMVNIISDNKIYEPQILKLKNLEIIGKVVSRFGKIY